MDFAHEGPGFPTWHRLFLLWLEREIQIEINDYTFRLPYWDWRDETQRDVLFNYDRLGENVNGTVNGRTISNNVWKTVCWHDTSDMTFPVNICNPNIPTAGLRRCPKPELCKPSNKYWPSYDDVDTTLSIEDYDAPPFDSFVKDNHSFRNFLEGFAVSLRCEQNDTMCTNTRGMPLTQIMHNTVSYTNEVYHMFCVNNGSLFFLCSTVFPLVPKLVAENICVYNSCSKTITC